MSGLAIASLVQSGVELHWTPSDQTFQAGLILIAVPSLLQLLACIFSYLARDGATGSAVGVLATSWLAIGLIHIAAKPGATSGTLGLLLVSASGVLGVSASAITSSKPLPGVIFAAAAVRFATAGIYQLSTVALWEHVAGLLGLLVTALAVYATLGLRARGATRAGGTADLPPRASRGSNSRRRRQRARSTRRRAWRARDNMINALSPTTRGLPRALAARNRAMSAHNPYSAAASNAHPRADHSADGASHPP